MKTPEPGWLFDTLADGVYTPASEHGRLELPLASKERIRRSLDLP